MKRSISTGNSFVEGNTNEKKASIERENQKQRLTRKCVLKLKNYSEDCFSDEYFHVNLPVFYWINRKLLDLV